jgi:hypothetical protein
MVIKGYLYLQTTGLQLAQFFLSSKAQFKGYLFGVVFLVNQPLPSSLTIDLHLALSNCKLF